MEYQEWEQFESEFKKQLSVLGKEKFSKQREFCTRMIEKNNANKKCIDEIDAFFRAQQMLVTGEDKNMTHFAIIGIAGFLWIYEIDYLHCLNYICYLLTNNGHDLFNGYNHKYAHSFDDVVKVNASAKHNFLEVHNFGMLNRKLDKKLRDQIAHHYFLLNKNGAIRIDGKVIDISDRSINLLQFCTEFWKSANTCLREISSKIQP